MLNKLRKLFGKTEDFNPQIIQQQISILIDIFLEERKYYILPEDRSIGVKPNASHINNGYCRDFAYQLQQRLLEHNIESEYIEVNLYNIPHAFLKIGGKYYDSECCDGVSRIKHLPLYRYP